MVGRPKRRRQVAAGIVAALAVVAGAAWLARRLDLPPPGASEAREAAPTARATRTARSLAQLERLDPTSLRSPLVLNEIATVNRNAIFDEDREPSDWIELYNRGDRTLALAGYGLADGRTSRRRWTLPDLELEPGGHLIVFASGKDRVGSALARHLGVVLDPGASAERDFLDPPVRIVEPEADEEPLRRILVAFDLPDAGPWDLWVGARAAGPRPARLRIASGEQGAWERVLQPSRRLRHVRVAAGVRGAGRRTLVLEAADAPVSIQRISFVRDDPEAGHLGLHLHTSFRLARSGETLVLLRPEGPAADYATPDRFSPGETWQRVPDGAAHFELALPTPRGRALSAEPDLSGAPSVAAAPFSLRVPVPAGVEVLRHTLDGSLPGPDAARLPSELRIGAPAVLRVRGFRDGRVATPVAARLFWVGPVPAAQVVMVGLDPHSLFDPQSGILPNNAGRGSAWERVARVLAFDRERIHFDGEAGLRTHAGNGRDRGNATSFQLRFRPSRGADRLAHDPFEPAATPPPDRLILDATQVAWTDALSYDLVRSAGGVAPRSRRGLLWINAALHNRVLVFEDVDDDFLTARFDHTDFDLIKGKPFRVKRGDLEGLRALAGRLERGPLRADDLDDVLDLDGILAIHFALLFADAAEGGRFQEDEIQGYLALDRRRAPERLYAIPWDLDHGFRVAGHDSLARRRAFVRRQPWDTRFLPEKVVDRLLDDDPGFPARYRAALERFLAAAAEPRFGAEIDALEDHDGLARAPVGAAPFARARGFFADRPAELRRQAAALGD